MAKAAYPTIGIAALVMFGIVYFIGCLQTKNHCIINKTFYICYTILELRNIELFTKQIMI